MTRAGNRFEARTRGVTRFTLLLWPEVIDFAAPVVVTVNGTVVHEALVAKDTGRCSPGGARQRPHHALRGGLANRGAVGAELAAPHSVSTSRGHA